MPRPGRSGLIPGDFALFGGRNRTNTMLFKMFHQVIANYLCHHGRDCISDLYGNTNLRAAPLERIGERLQSCRLPMRDRSIFRGMQVASLLGFVEFATNRTTGWAFPFQPAKQIGSALLFAYPTSWRKFGGKPLKIKPITALGNELVTTKRNGSRIAGNMQVRADCGRRKKFPVCRL